MIAELGRMSPDDSGAFSHGPTPLSSTSLATADLAEFAHRLQQQHDSRTTPAQRKERGHFGTPPAVARLMVDLFPRVLPKSIRLLDDGAGVGTLTAAVCDRVVEWNAPRQIHVEAWENDPALVPHLIETLEQSRRVGQATKWRVTLSSG